MGGQGWKDKIRYNGKAGRSQKRNILSRDRRLCQHANARACHSEVRVFHRNVFFKIKHNEEFEGGKREE